MRNLTMIPSPHLLIRPIDGRKIRALTIVDNYSRQCIAIHVGQLLKAEDVVAVMNHLKIVDLTIPQRIQVGYGSEFISKAPNLWAYDNGIILDFPGLLNRPTTHLLNRLMGVFATSA